MLYAFHAWNNLALFHTGRFIESLFTRVLIIHVVCTNKIRFIRSRAPKLLILTSLLIVAIGEYLTISPLASTLGFVTLPSAYWLYFFAMLTAYVAFA